MASRLAVECLRPWHAIAVAAARIDLQSLRDRDENDSAWTLWVQWHPQRGHSPRTTIELLELLHLLTAVDMCALPSLFASTTCGEILRVAVDDHHQRRSPDGASLRLGFDVHVGDLGAFHSGWFYEFGMRHVDNYADSEHSHEFIRAREALLELRPKDQRDDLTKPIPVRMSISHLAVDPTSGITDCETVYDQCRQIAVVQADPSFLLVQRDASNQERPSEIAPSRFRIQSFRFMPLPSRLGWPCLRMLQQMMAVGLPVDALQFRQLSTNAINVAFTRTVLLLLKPVNDRTIVGGSLPGRLPTGLSHVDIGDDVSPRSFKALCSAVATSQTLREVSVTEFPLERNDRLAAWRWLGFALFSCVARHHIEKLTIQLTDAEFHLEGVEEMARVMTDTNPFRFLTESSSPSISRVPSSVRVAGRAQCGVQLHMNDPNNSGCLRNEPGIQLRNGSIIPVVGGQEQECDKATEWLQVLVPGWGIGWLDRTDTVDNPHVVVDPPTEKLRRSIAHVRLIHTHASEPALISLMAHIGNSIRRLELVFSDGQGIGPKFVEDVLSRCPNIHWLSIETSTLFKSTWLVSAYNTGACRAETLELFALKLDDNAFGFVLALGTKAEAISGCTLDIQIEFRHGPRNKLVQALMIEQVLATLATNTRLRRCTIWIHDEDTRCSDTLQLQYGDKLRAHCGQVVSVHKSELAPQCKVAFLGAQAALPCSLNSDSLALIFAFAADCWTRVCSLGCLRLDA